MTAVHPSKETWCEAEVHRHRVAGEIALKWPERDAAKAEAYFECALVVAREQLTIAADPTAEPLVIAGISDRGEREWQYALCCKQ
jgi:hypothetical protein